MLPWFALIIGFGVGREKKRGAALAAAFLAHKKGPARSLEQTDLK